MTWAVHGARHGTSYTLPARPSSDPESHPKVGFESVSGLGFGFRVSSIEANFSCPFRDSGFGFRRLKPTFAVGFRFRVSGFELRRLKPTFAVGFGFRVSSFVDWNPLLLSVSGFGFRVSSIEANFSCPFRDSFFFVSGFWFRRLKLTLAVRFRVRVSGFVGRNHL